MNTTPLMQASTARILQLDTDDPEESVLSAWSPPSTSIAPRVDALGAIPAGFEWIDDEPGYVGQVDDPCVSIQGQINNLNAARKQIISDANEAALLAQQAGAPQSQIDAIVAQKNSAVATIDGQLAELKKLLADCKKLAPGCDPNTPCPAGMVCVDGKCVTPTAPPPPQCGPNNPCPAGQECVAGTCIPKQTSTTKPASRSWLLLAVAAVGATFFAFKGG